MGETTTTNNQNKRFTKYKCKHFKAGYMPCELCVIHKTFIDLQNADCNSCFAPLLTEPEVK